jgi:hypothetical protein
MTKIAYNACYGGFSLSNEAILHYANLKDITLYKGKSNSLYFTSQDLKDKSCFLDRDISRTDPDLIKTIETLGPKANGHFANLQIRDLPIGTKYRIDEYDGNEAVITQDEYEWEIA